MTTTDQQAEETFVDAEQVDKLVAAELDAAGVTADQLRSAAKLGRFDSEAHRRLWFILSSLNRL